jgi:hypothetical protein
MSKKFDKANLGIKKSSFTWALLMPFQSCHGSLFCQLGTSRKSGHYEKREEKSGDDPCQ